MGKLVTKFAHTVDRRPRFQLIPLSTVHDGPVVDAAERSTRLRVPTKARREMPRSTVFPDDPENRWSHRELIENGKLLRNASQYNSLLRLTALVMSPGGSGLWRPEEGPTAIKIEGEPYRFVHAGDYDSESLQYFLSWCGICRLAF